MEALAKQEEQRSAGNATELRTSFLTCRSVDTQRVLDQELMKYLIKGNRKSRAGKTDEL